MPAKNSLKPYISNAFYHIYNRGVEKRIIFQENQDYSVFLSYLKEYLLPKNEQELREKLNNPKLLGKEKDQILKAIRMNNFTDEIDLACFCLMPNHFHLLVRQSSADSIARFMSSLCTRYGVYFNKKYHRVGSLFQGVYKGIHVDSEEYLLELTRYIHFQARKRTNTPARPSSIEAYLGLNNPGWIKPGLILPYFSKTNPSLTYQSFVTQTDKRSSFSNIKPLLLE